MSRGPEFSLAGLSAEESKVCDLLLKRKQQLERQIKQAETGQMAFAGKFRKPDDITVLRRGDPEQPGEPVTPASIAA